jgi:tRNA (Thr-GGU) A37 N-methylase
MITPMPRPNAITPPPKQVGLFASRAPHRPNPIALSALEIISINKNNVSCHTVYIFSIYNRDR